MSIHSLHSRTDLSDFPKVQTQYLHLAELIEELNAKDLPSELNEQINVLVNQINSTPTGELKHSLSKAQIKITNQVEKATKIVPKGYYRNLWLPLGMSAFGLPIGVALGASLGNMAYLGIGLPIGLGIGTSLGISLDKKAEKEGRQLNWEAKRF